MENLDIQNKCTFDYVLLDLQMPIMDGYQTIKKLRELESERKIILDDTKIIALSAISEN